MAEFEMHDNVYEPVFNSGMPASRTFREWSKLSQHDVAARAGLMERR